MATKRDLQAQYEFLALPALQGGLDSLQDWERMAVAMLYVKEVRKGTFRFEGDDDDAHVRAFLEHVMAQFVISTDLKVVFDFQPRLLATAKDLAQRPHPIESVILYATWCEHWLNATLITAALARGLTEDQVTQLVRDCGIRAKLSWLWSTLQLPHVPEHLRSAVEFLAEVRNEHVHYKWKGHDPDVITSNNRLALAISDIDAVVTGLIDFEVGTLVAPHIEVADRLFGVSLAPEWRAAALTRPLSAPKLTES